MRRRPLAPRSHCAQSAPKRLQAVCRASLRTSLSPPVLSVCAATSAKGARAAGVLRRAKRSRSSWPRASLTWSRCVCSSARRASTSSSADCWPLICSSSSAMRAEAWLASAAASSRTCTSSACSWPVCASFTLRHFSLYLASISALCRSCRCEASSASKAPRRSALSASEDAMNFRCSSSCWESSSHKVSKTCKRCLPSSTAFPSTSSLSTSFFSSCPSSSATRPARSAATSAALLHCWEICCSSFILLASASRSRCSYPCSCAAAARTCSSLAVISACNSAIRAQATASVDASCATCSASFASRFLLSASSALICCLHSSNVDCSCRTLSVSSVASAYEPAVCSTLSACDGGCMFLICSSASLLRPSASKVRWSPSANFFMRSSISRSFAATCSCKSTKSSKVAASTAAAVPFCLASLSSICLHLAWLACSLCLPSSTALARASSCSRAWAARRSSSSAMRVGMSGASLARCSSAAAATSSFVASDRASPPPPDCSFSASLLSRSEIFEVAIIMPSANRFSLPSSSSFFATLRLRRCSVSLFSLMALLDASC
mmetsp:Transcript_33919/g.97522  ORF Transcript_33919/g.97522 Transcript_33919/m.97522 type:complete len:553 (-) Transcript_33919:1372-3030(-)